MKARPCLDPSVRIVVLDDGMIAYDRRRDVIHDLNPTAALILAFCDGSHETGEIEAAVASLGADVGGTGQGRIRRADTRAWLKKARDAGLLARNGTRRGRRELLKCKELARLVDTLHEQGEISRAFRCQRRLLEMHPNDSDGWYKLGELAHAMGDWEEAREAYTRYLRDAPDDAEVSHLLIALNDAQPPPRVPDDCVVQIFDGFAETYDELMRDELEYRAPELLLDALKNSLPEPGGDLRVADLGCGTGLSGPLVRPWARHLIGVDLSPEMASYSCATGAYDEIHISEITTWLTSGKRPFDLMVASDVMIYFGRLEELFGAVASTLTVGGVLGCSFEKHEGDGFHLTRSGRYAHGEAYLREVARRSGLTPVHLSTDVVRTEYGKPVPGWILVLERTG